QVSQWRSPVAVSSTAMPGSAPEPANDSRARPDSTDLQPAGIGHVHLRVADLERSLNFYHGVLGFEIVQRWGTQAAFLAAPGSGYRHHLGLNTWESKGGPPPPRGS